MKKSIQAVLAASGVIVVAGIGAWLFFVSAKPSLAPTPSVSEQPDDVTGVGDEVQPHATTFGDGVRYEAPTVAIDPGISADVDVRTLQNVRDMEAAFKFAFSNADLKNLADRKFVLKKLTDTGIRPNSGGDNLREFVQLYDQVKGPNDFRDRGPQNALFYSSDVFFHAYNNLYTELLKEMENKTFYPAVTAFSESFYKSAAAKEASATTGADKKKWTKVRNYFAVPYAVFSTAERTLGNDDYYKDGVLQDPAKVMSDYKTKDAEVDTYDNAAAFVKKLGLDAASEAAVLADLKKVYDSNDKGVPEIFSEEYKAYASREEIAFAVDFSQFTPRGTYTSSSLRREYFRGMKWYIMLPFFLKDPDLTSYAFAASQLMAENPAALKDYDRLESAINFMVGKSDDLMPADYLSALASAKGAPDASAAAMDYLVKARNPQIKDLAAIYPAVGTVQSADVLLKTKGMRFFSGKFIIDSYWTGFLTQGDEAPRPGYSQKLPPMASSLEVMALLGSDYAESQIPTLDFYSKSNDKAIAQALAELKEKNGQLSEDDWRRNLYFAWLWTIKGVFDWEKTHLTELPRFMQSPAWSVKTLQTASAFWTELRHATILYAKQSFAELGGGGPGCDTHAPPAPPKAYIEPQLEAYARLAYLTKRTGAGLKEQGYELQNMVPLENFSTLLDKVQEYVKKELGNEALREQVDTNDIPDPNDDSKTCKYSSLNGESDWEALRIGIVGDMKASIPVPVEGPVLSAKDRRAALVADVHTGGDSSYPPSILYEGTGVPYVIFTAVSDTNGPRLTVGFVSSHYEFTTLYGGKRMTDEAWQTNFYVGEDPYDAFDYTRASTWPKLNAWYAPLFSTSK